MGRDGKMHQAGYCDKITKDTKDLENGWYAVVDNVKNNNRINCKGNVNLILCDGTTLDAPKGITVNEGNNLTIWGQENNAGKLTVNSPEKGAACIGGHYASSGQITINGGDINVQGRRLCHDQRRHRKRDRLCL